VPHLLRVSRKRERWPSKEDFPFAVNAIRTFDRIDVNVGVTFFVGENGSGKSTLLEGIASAADLPTSDGTLASMDATLGNQRALGDELRLAWLVRSRKGLFLRAEDFFGQIKSRARAHARVSREKEELRTGESGPVLTDDGMHVDEKNARRFVEAFDARSHGESFMDVFQQINPGGLYLFDEPEAPLSPTRQIRALEMIEKKADAGAQFIIATHSPILLSCKGARIFSFDDPPIAEVSYGDLEHVRVTRDFLNRRG
jgi:predicted ATPase